MKRIDINRELALQITEMLRVFRIKYNDSPKYARCEVRFNEDITTEEDIIAIYPYNPANEDEKLDEHIFFYCSDIDELLELTKEDNGENFVVMNVLEFFNDID